MNNRQYQLSPGTFGFGYIKNQSGAVIGIKNEELGYSIIFRSGGHPPRSGVVFSRALNLIPFKGARVLDVGTGESALLAIHAARLGAREVIGVDIDPVAIKWAYKNVGLNNLFTKITLKRIAIYKYAPHTLFDVIIANPPQMPSNESKSTHDDGGVDGKKYIYQIIDFAAKFLKPEGLLIFMASDFLGINATTNNQETVFNFLTRNGFRPRVVNRFLKVIKKDSYTNHQLPWIRNQYPHYVFRRNKSGAKVHWIYAVRAKKT